MKDIGNILYKVFLLVLFCLLLPSLVWAFPVSDVREEPITSGAVLVRQKATTSAGAVKVYMIKVDLNNEYIRVDTMVGKDGSFQENQQVTPMARSTGAVAAINGDFFQMAESGRPIGLTFSSGNLIGSPAMRTDMFGFGLTSEKLPLISIFDFKGRVLASNGADYEIFGINKPGYNLLSGGSSDKDKLLMYTPAWGKKTRENIKGIGNLTEAVVVNNEVTVVHTGKGGTSIPTGGYVLSGNGPAADFILKNLPVGSKAEVQSQVAKGSDILWPGKLISAVGGQALLVDSGVVPKRFTQDISGRHARTAVGISREGDILYLVAVEKSANSPGMDQRELAEHLVSQGVWRAVNLDGGGSTTIAARHLGDTEASLINTPQAGSQRAVPNAIGVYSTAPGGMFKGLILQGPQVVITGVGAKYSIKAYDEYFNPYALSVNEVNFSATPGYGEFVGNTFRPAKSGKVELIAGYNNERSRLEVEVLGPDKMAGLEVEPSSIQVEPGKTVTFKAKVKVADGRYFDLAGTDVNWSVSKEIGTVKDGLFTASKNVGAGKITASFEGLSVDILVEVRTGDAIAVELEPGWPTEAWINTGLRAYFPKDIVDKTTTVKLTRSSVANVSLPQGLKPIKALNVGLGDDSLKLNNSWQLHWEFTGLNLTDRIALYKWDNTGNVWAELPSYLKVLDEENGIKLLTARLWATGQYIAVLDERSVPKLTDMAGHWAKAAVNEMASKGVITGYPEGDFRPQNGVTRAEFVAMLGRSLGWDSLHLNDPGSNFTDEIPTWAAEHIAASIMFKVVEGYPDGTFQPNKKIDRAEMAVIINRALQLNVKQGDSGSPAYKDYDRIPVWARDDVMNASAAGLLQGDEGLFRPANGATRAESATVISRAQQMWVCEGLVYTR
ncbi:MAG TPA: S-layer homology domain-containing protein [Clostridia bacterium]|nr:S-layer homology domain-containing protein [Clostridia bacterium]